MKRFCFFTVILTALAYLFFFPQKAFLASVNGLNLWFHTVLPSLLPFLILSYFLIHTGLIPRLLNHFRSFFQKFLGLSPYGGYALCLGLFCFLSTSIQIHFVIPKTKNQDIYNIK